MANAKSDSEKILAALQELHSCIENLFIMEACRVGINQQEIRAILGIKMARVTRIAKHVKQGK